MRMIPLKQTVNPKLLQIWLPRSVSLIMVILIGISLAQIVQKTILSNQTPLTETKPTLGNIAVIKPNMAFQHAGLIAQSHLFGEVGSAITNTPTIAPDTQLNLKLLGILATGNIYGIAIIYGDNQEKFYKVGDLVPGNATLREVYPDHVILQSSRGYETLRLPIERDSTFIPTDIEAYLPPTPSHDITEYDYILSNLTDIQEARTPDGEFQGFRFTPQDQQLAESLNIMPDDIIVAVGDFRITNAADIETTLFKLRNTKVLNITILRGDQEITREHDP